MSQAETDVTPSTEKPFEPRLFHEGAAERSLMNIYCVLKFVGQTADAAANGGMKMDDDVIGGMNCILQECAEAVLNVRTELELAEVQSDL